MIFSSASFLAGFLPIVLAGFLTLRWLKQWHLSQLWLLVSSVVFYAFSGTSALPVLVGSVAINFAAGFWLHQTTAKKQVLTLGILFNLGLLGFFKYWCFVYQQFSGASCALNFELPLAISFFTFQQIAWLCDVYSGKVVRVKPINYALFVTFFPQLIAGPIVHYRYVRKQFEQRQQLPRGTLFFLGIIIFCLGLAKKVLLADSLKGLVDGVYGFGIDTDHIYALQDIIIASFGFGLQLYFDFSGYADMAIGLSAMFGIRLPINFRSPYRSTSIIDFWRHWHITLSRFLRDYLYIPLGGGYRGKFRRYSNLMITMLLGGLWHGAGWGFVLWGGAHGFLLCLNHLSRYYLPGGLPTKVGGGLGWVLTFTAANLLWVLFRAESLNHAVSIYQDLFHLRTWSLGWEHLWLTVQLLKQLRLENLPVIINIAVFMMALIVVLQPVSTTRIWNGGHGKPKHGICLFAGFLLSLSLKQLVLVESATFVYFRF